MTILDKYVLSQMMRRLLVALGIVLLMLVLERVLRLFEFAAANNAAFGLIAQMAANLIPHYLGLAIPAAFFISILLLMAQMGENSELDVILGSGVSVSRMARPLIFAGILLSILSIGLLGYAQPFSRYAYRAIKYEATNALWNEVISERTFFSPTDGLTVFANDIDLEGRGFKGVFVHQITDSGQESTTTAAKGQTETDEETGQTKIVLEDVVQIIERPDQPPFNLYLGTSTYIPNFPFVPGPFRDRGSDQRELTLGELWRKNALSQPATTSEDIIEQAKVSAEVNGRLVRSISLASMPFLAVPMGMAAKRRRRGAAIVTAVIILLLYHYTLQLSEGLVGLGIVSPLLGLWLPFAIFSLFCINLLRRADRRLRPDAFEHLFDTVDKALQMIKRLFLRKRHQ